MTPTFLLTVPKIVDHLLCEFHGRETSRTLYARLDLVANTVSYFVTIGAETTTFVDLPAASAFYNTKQS